MYAHSGMQSPLSDVKVSPKPPTPTGGKDRCLKGVGETSPRSQTRLLGDWSSGTPRRAPVLTPVRGWDIEVQPAWLVTAPPAFPSLGVFCMRQLSSWD